jgi:hypothetical protein
MDGKMTTLRISRMRDGGFLVGQPSDDYSFSGGAPAFASTSIEEAMKYIKRKLETEHQAKPDKP